MSKREYTSLPEIAGVYAVCGLKIFGCEVDLYNFIFSKMYFQIVIGLL